MESIDVSRALVLAPGQERLVRRRFWSKLKRAIGRLPLIDHMLAAYYAASDPLTPAHVKAALWAALAYFVVPADLLPDFIVGGFADDVAVLMGVIQAFAPHITDAHRRRARGALSRIAD
jgi:uncharacterized membrane protein YkvA (DUF1232 family)